MAQLGSNLSSEMETLNQVLTLVEAFRAFDGDNDGAITAAELGGLMASLGYKPSEQDVRGMMERGDTDKDGLLSIEEFLDMNTNELELGSLANVMESAVQALNSHGRDDDVLITAEELRKALGDHISLAACQEIIDSMDTDGDRAVPLVDIRLIINALL